MRNLMGLFSILILVAAAHAAEGDGFKPLFNGKDLTNWDGNTKFWSVKDGVIVGETTKENPTKGNTFIIYRGGELKDFELHVKFKFGKSGNSGIQYRSKDMKNWVMGGYQFDISNESIQQMGKLYEERGKRGRMNLAGEKVIWTADNKKNLVGPLEDMEKVKSAWKKDDWNEVAIIAKGNHIIHKLNGVTVVDFTDDNAEQRLMSGLLGLQIHAGPPMKVEFKDIEVKELN